jgi:addiction module HigA family antidote
MLSSALNARAGTTPDMAVRLGFAFGTSPETWRNHQAHYDLRQVRKARHRPCVRQLDA